MNKVSNAQTWHRRLGYLDTRSLELMQRHDGNGINFDGTIVDYDVCAVEKRHQLTNPKKAQPADIIRPFQLCCGYLMDSFTSEAAYGVFQYVSKITDQFIKWGAAYLLASKSLVFDSTRLFITSVVIPFGGHVKHSRAGKGGEYAGEAFKQCGLETDITQEFAATNTPQQIGAFKRVSQTLCSIVHFYFVDSGFPPRMWRSCARRLTSATVRHSI